MIIIMALFDFCSCQVGVLGVHGEIVHALVVQELVFELDNVITQDPRMEEHHV